MRLRSNDSREERTQDPVRAMGQGSLPALAQALPACLSLWGTDTNLHPWPWPVSIKGGMSLPTASPEVFEFWSDSWDEYVLLGTNFSCFETGHLSTFEVLLGSPAPRKTAPFCTCPSK
jgi:hypothetical protein